MPIPAHEQRSRGARALQLVGFPTVLATRVATTRPRTYNEDTMFEWLGALRVRSAKPARVERGLAPGTKIVGWIACAVGVVGVFAVIAASRWLAMLPGAIAAVGAMLASTRRSLIFDGNDGVLRVENSVFGLTSRSIIPLFHLRAVVVETLPSRNGGEPTYVAYVERRVGGRIRLDESSRVAPLLRVAEAISRATELRMVFDASSRAAEPF